MRSMAAPDHFVTEDHKTRFLEMLRKTGNPSVAARSIGFAPATMKRHREADAEFDREWHEAESEASDALEAEARRRAVEGVLREKCIGGGKDGKFIEEVEYSDQLLLALLKANKPEKFADRSKTEVSNPDGSLAPQNDRELAVRLASFLALAQARAQEAK